MPLKDGYEKSNRQKSTEIRRNSIRDTKVTCPRTTHSFSISRLNRAEKEREESST